MSPEIRELEAPPMEKLKMRHAGEFEVTKGKVRGFLHPIPMPLWQAIVGFHRAVSIKYNAESVSYHRYYEKEGRYHTIIPYQETSLHGLSVSQDWTDHRNQELIDKYAEMYGEEFFPACTIHTHVDIAAFESGTDASDEENQPGWHITLGKLITHKEYDLDFRMRIPKIKRFTQLTRTDCAYDLTWDWLFQKGTKKEEVFTAQGTTDFEKFIERVNAK